MSCAFANYLIVTALAMEAKAIARAFGVSLAGSNQATVLPVEGQARLRVVGMGAAGMSADLLHGMDGVILAGLAGALDPSLNVGDLVVDQSAMGHHIQLSDRIQTPYRQGLIHTADHVVSTPVEKAMLLKTTGALAVDMETAIVQRIAHGAGIPMLTIRAVSDTASQSVPRQVATWIGVDGRLRPAAVACGLSRRPDLIPSLIRLGNQSQRAVLTLADALRAMWKPSRVVNEMSANREFQPK